MDTDIRQTILVVDDTPENIDILSGILRQNYKVKAALNGERALKIANAEQQPDMVLLDIMMPGMDGYEVCRQLKANPRTRHIPIIFITTKDQQEDEENGFELGAVDYINKPITPAIVEARVKTHLALFNQNQTLEKKVAKRTEQLKSTQLQIIQRLGRAAEFKDDETGLHVIRMSHFTRLMAEALSDEKEWIDLIFHAAPMHDIGKIGIPDHVLLKPGKLDDEEWNIMRRHPKIGAEIIGDGDSRLLKMAQEIAYTHHEKWDGSGYPRRLKGEEIPLTGRIVAIADVFDALTSERPYKKAWDIEAAVKLIDDEAGKHFDPSLVAIFHSVLPEILDIKDQYAERSASGKLSALSK